MSGFKANNTKINRAKKRAFRIVYNDYGESLKELLQSFTKYLKLTLIFMQHSDTAHYGKSLTSVFQELFASINKIFILAEGLDTMLSFYKV